jgi:hypothetical protein
MGLRQDAIEELDEATRYIVIERDQGKCVDCSKPYHDIHEIVSRSHFGTRHLDKCFKVKNRCCVCRRCHDYYQGDHIKELLELMQEKYRYDYSERPWSLHLG